jgi:hypothetical protein
MRRWIACVALSITAAPAFAQTLADVARQEEARRAVAPKGSRVYSNGSLMPGEVREQSVLDDTGSCYMSITQNECVTAEQMLENSRSRMTVVENAPKESVIRQQAGALRGELARIQREIDTLKVQAGDERRSATQRQQAENTLADRIPSLAHAQRRWARLEKTIDEHKFPHAWIEPIPPNASRRSKRLE